MSTSTRLALLVGSQCGALEPFPFLERPLLSDLRDLLVDGPGDCTAAGGGILLNPTLAKARASLHAAVRAAHEAESILVLHVLAHRWSDGDGHAVAVWDSGEGWDPLEDLRRAAPSHRGLAGVVLMIDAYHDSATNAAVRSWSGTLGAAPAVSLVATGTEPLLTRTALGALRSGVTAAAHPRRTLVAELLASDIELLAFAQASDGGRQRTNPALFIGRNRTADEVVRRLGLDAGTARLILRLTRDYCDHATAPVAAAAEQNRVVTVIGDRGTGKSTLAAALRLAPEASEVPIGLVHAAAFVSTAGGLPGLARSLGGQLASLAEYEQAAERFASASADRWESLGVWQREVIGPLGVLRQHVRLLIDGVDELDADEQDALRIALTQLLDSAPLASLILIGRDGTLFPGAAVVRMPVVDDETARRFLRRRGISEAAHDAVVDRAAGLWLALDLASGHSGASLDELCADVINRARSDCGPAAKPILQLLAAAGVGPLVPLDVLRVALGRLGQPAWRGETLAVLGDETLARVVDRAFPGTGGDRVGLFHRSLIDYITARVDLDHAHCAIAEALGDLSARHGTADAYAFAAQPEHWWHAGRADLALASLHDREDQVPRVNLAHWHRWSKRFERTLGANHPITLSARGNVAFWTGECGDGVVAVERFAALLPDLQSVLGADHPTALATRRNIAQWTGEIGDSAGALDAFQALQPELERVLGADHPDTLATLQNIAYWTARTGDVYSALELAHSLLPDVERVLGVDHPQTRTTHALIDQWTTDLAN